LKKESKSTTKKKYIKLKKILPKKVEKEISYKDLVKNLEKEIIKKTNIGKKAKKN
jgi:hypothetical protein